MTYKVCTPSLIHRCGMNHPNTSSMFLLLNFHENNDLKEYAMQMQ